VARAETVRKGNLGKTDLRLVKSDGRFYGLADGMRITEGADADDVWRRLHDEAGKANPKYFGYAGARARFLHWFSGGFESRNFLEQERKYKLDAKRKLDQLAVEDAATGSGHGPVVWTAYQTNLLSPYEKMWVREALLSPQADDFVRAAARFALGEGTAALLQMERALKPHGAAKWTIITYLPFLWRPEEHMYLKPEATKDFAARVGHRFANEYEAKLTLGVYESLLDLAAKTAAELAELKPRDRIDVQSFIWVVGDYQEGREQPRP
jgi:hypothetical protein